MKLYRIVIDTNVIVSALKSNRGASYKLLSLGEERFQLCISVPIVIEYEDVLKRDTLGIPLNNKDINDILDYICSVADKRVIFYLWRPYLKDPKDDMILELAVESESNFIITYNQKNFTGIEKFGISVLSPKEFLTIIGEIK